MIDIEGELLSIFRREGYSDAASYSSLLAEALAAMSGEDPAVRPRDSGGRPGGLVLLRRDAQTIIVPDLHARMDFFLRVLLAKDAEGWSNLEKMISGELQVVCVGDGFHSEDRGRQRWQEALAEFEGGFAAHSSMDEEMAESLGVMEMVMRAKVRFPGYFHFLKGNHENVANERGGGNFPFAKYAMEGPMVASWVRTFMGEPFLARYSSFEKAMPVLAVGRNFLVSHAEPRDFYDRPTIVEYRRHPEAIEGLTWTDNDAATEGSVSRMLAAYLGADEAAGAYYFGGHRAIKGIYGLRAGGRYVQIHNPRRFIVASIGAEGGIDLERDIIELPGGD
jgi:hypothetical protein